MFLKAGGESYHDVGSGIKGSFWILRRWIQSSLMSWHWKGRRKLFPQLSFLGRESLTGITKPLDFNFPGFHMEKNNGREGHGKSKELLHAVSDSAQAWQSLQCHQQPHNKAMVDSRGGKTWDIWKAQLSKATYFHQQQAWDPLFRGGVIWMKPESIRQQGPKELQTNSYRKK